MVAYILMLQLSLAVSETSRPPSMFLLCIFFFMEEKKKVISLLFQVFRLKAEIK